MALIVVFCLLWNLYCCLTASVFLRPDEALAVLVRTRRSNSVLVRTRRSNSGWLEELQKGDLERECLEEKCSYEEAREVFEHTESTDEFWRTYSLPDSCASGPCVNQGTCVNQGDSFMCLCRPQFSGRSCELEYNAVPDTCLLENGGCEHFCEEEAGSVKCSCADGYFLHHNNHDCLPAEPIACGMVPVLQNQGGGSEDKADQVDPRSRIVGGTECPKGECPWQVLLVYRDKGFCGGIIIHPTWVLTASHCMENTRTEFLRVVAGEHNTAVEEHTEQSVGVLRIVTHEDYVSRTADNDIALLRLSAPIVWTPYAVPVCLPTRPLAERSLWAVGTHTVSGWGQRSENGPTSHLLRRLQVPRIRTQECVEQSGVVLTDNMFCAGYLEGRQDSCKGDSGGPLVTQYKKTYFLLGIVSWGKGCARPGNYGIYTRVSNYLDWIHHKTHEPPTTSTTERPTTRTTEGPTTRTTEGPTTRTTEGPTTRTTERPTTRTTERPTTRTTGPPRANGTGPPRANGTGPPRANGTGPPRANGTGPPRANGTEPTTTPRNQTDTLQPTHNDTLQPTR